MNYSKKTLSILGGGKFGSALAYGFSTTHNICIWSRSGSSNEEKIITNKNVWITENFVNAILHSDVIMIAISVANIENCFEDIFKSIINNTTYQKFYEIFKQKHFIICSKGITKNGLLSKVLLNIFGKFNLKFKSIGILGGANFSIDILNNSIVFADISAIFFEDLFKIYHYSDNIAYTNIINNIFHEVAIVNDNSAKLQKDLINYFAHNAQLEEQNTKQHHTLYSKNTNIQSSFLFKSYDGNIFQCQLAGALKNIYAILSGITRGLNLINLSTNNQHRTSPLENEIQNISKSFFSGIFVNFFQEMIAFSDFYLWNDFFETKFLHNNDQKSSNICLNNTPTSDNKNIFFFMTYNGIKIDSNIIDNTKQQNFNYNFIKNQEKISTSYPFLSYSGLADFYATCTSKNSRNYKLGILISKFLNKIFANYSNNLNIISTLIETNEYKDIIDNSECEGLNTIKTIKNQINLDRLHDYKYINFLALIYQVIYEDFSQKTIDNLIKRIKEILFFI